MNLSRSRKAIWLPALLGLLFVPSRAALATDGTLSGSGTSRVPDFECGQFSVGPWSLQVQQSGSAVSGLLTYNATNQCAPLLSFSVVYHLTGGDIAGTMTGNYELVTASGVLFTGSGSVVYSLTGGTWGLGYIFYGLDGGHGAIVIDSGTLVLTPTVYAVQALYDQTKAVKSGGTIPIKLQVLNGSGANVSSSSLVVNATGLVQKDNQPDGELTDAGNANADNNFRYDATLQGYIYNLKTTGLASGTWCMTFTVNGQSDPRYQLIFNVK